VDTRTHIVEVSLPELGVNWWIHVHTVYIACRLSSVSKLNTHDYNNK